MGITDLGTNHVECERHFSQKTNFYKRKKRTPARTPEMSKAFLLLLS